MLFFVYMIYITNSLHFVLSAHCSGRKDLLKKYDPHNIERRHKEQFVSWFEDKVSYQKKKFVHVMIQVMKAVSKKLFLSAYNILFNLTADQKRL